MRPKTRKRFLLLAGLILFLSVLTGPQAARARPIDEDAVLEAVPPELKERVSRSLLKAGTNEKNLLSCFEKLEGKEREGWAFLVAHMEPADAKSITAPVLLEHIRYAYKARAELPWTAKLPRAIFLNYVLPFRSAQEPIESWRKRFFEEIFARLKKVKKKTLEEAALEVNRYCGEKVKFKPTPPEDKGPLQILALGYGRCEEMMIFFNAVARSAGIPARSVYTPYWTFQDNNHAWCEVWTGKETRPGSHGWHYLGACEPADRLDHAWFDAAVKRAALVLSSCPGKPEWENILAVMNNTSIINSTPVYTETTRMTVRVTDEKGTPAGGAVIFLCVFNTNALRSILQVATDARGAFSFDLGPGDYFLSAVRRGRFGWTIAHSNLGGETPVTIVLDDKPPEGFFELRYPVPGKG